ncbi:hypothetical protein [Alistipes sp.]|uniref:hypothetical protein n=1 Tax=Alistipes sp. TaxID=1872444 RepID=UPI0025C6670C|nr:hypothetical protein [Alistipes sp.]
MRDDLISLEEFGIKFTEAIHQAYKENEKIIPQEESFDSIDVEKCIVSVRRSMEDHRSNGIVFSMDEMKTKHPKA